MKRITFAIALAGLLVMAGTLAGATMLRPMDLAGLSVTSTAVVLGTCVQSESRLEEDGIYTYSTIQVADSAKGIVGPNVVVRTPGGAVPVPGRTDGLMRMDIVPGVPEFAPGQESILFLWKPQGSPAGMPFHLLGFEMGKLDITAGGMVVRDAFSLITFDAPGNAGPIDAGVLMERVRGLAKRGGR